MRGQYRHSERRAAQALGDSTTMAYERALGGIRATQRGEEPLKPGVERYFDGYEH